MFADSNQVKEASTAEAEKLRALAEGALARTELMEQKKNVLDKVPPAVAHEANMKLDAATKAAERAAEAIARACDLREDAEGAVGDVLWFAQQQDLQKSFKQRLQGEAAEERIRRLYELGSAFVDGEEDEPFAGGLGAFEEMMDEQMEDSESEVSGSSASEDSMSAAFADLAAKAENIVEESVPVDLGIKAVVDPDSEASETSWMDEESETSETSSVHAFFELMHAKKDLVSKTEDSMETKGEELELATAEAEPSGSVLEAFELMQSFAEAKDDEDAESEFEQSDTGIKLSEKTMRDVAKKSGGFRAFSMDALSVEKEAVAEIEATKSGGFLAFSMDAFSVEKEAMVEIEASTIKASEQAMQFAEDGREDVEDSDMAPFAGTEAFQLVKDGKFQDAEASSHISAMCTALGISEKAKEGEYSAKGRRKAEVALQQQSGREDSEAADVGTKGDPHQDWRVKAGFALPAVDAEANREGEDEEPAELEEPLDVPLDPYEAYEKFLAQADGRRGAPESDPFASGVDAFEEMMKNALKVPSDPESLSRFEEMRKVVRRKGMQMS